MTVLDRLLAHDAWTTRQLLLRCRELTDDQWNRALLGGRSLHSTFEHLVECMELHMSALTQRASGPAAPDDSSLDGLLARHTVVAKDLAEVAMRVEREGTADAMLTVPRNGDRRSNGSLIGHLITHSAHHRAQILLLLELLGVEDAIEGDVLGWESTARGWGWDDGGSMGKMVAG